MISQAKIETILREADIEGFIESGAPDDEYDSEAKEIARALNRLKDSQFTEDNIISIVIRVWAKMFNLDEGDIQKRMPAFQSVTQKILALKSAT